MELRAAKNNATGRGGGRGNGWSDGTRLALPGDRGVEKEPEYSPGLRESIRGSIQGECKCVLWVGAHARVVCSHPHQPDFQPVDLVGASEGNGSSQGSSNSISRSIKGSISTSYTVPESCLSMGKSGNKERTCPTIRRAERRSFAPSLSTRRESRAETHTHHLSAAPSSSLPLLTAVKGVTCQRTPSHPFAHCRPHPRGSLRCKDVRVSLHRYH